MKHVLDENRLSLIHSFDFAEVVEEVIVVNGSHFESVGHEASTRTQRECERNTDGSGSRLRCRTVSALTSGKSNGTAILLWSVRLQ